LLAGPDIEVGTSEDQWVTGVMVSDYDDDSGTHPFVQLDVEDEPPA
jgi:hypothetical protein